MNSAFLCVLFLLLAQGVRDVGAGHTDAPWPNDGPQE